MIDHLDIEVLWGSGQAVTVHVKILPSLFAPPKDVTRPINPDVLESREKFRAFLEEITAPELPQGKVTTLCLARDLSSLIHVLEVKPPLPQPIQFDLAHG
jgi:hypothetical protein